MGGIALSMGSSICDISGELQVWKKPYRGRSDGLQRSRNMLAPWVLRYLG